MGFVKGLIAREVAQRQIDEKHVFVFRRRSTRRCRAGASSSTTRTRNRSTGCGIACPFRES
jgi:hypothetical protein